MKSMLKFVISFLITLSFLSAQILSSEEIVEIQKRVQSLPDETVSPEEVAVIETGSGVIVFEFYPFVAPIHCMNFKKLANSGYYNGTTFHRVIPDFVIQGGDILSRDIEPGNDGTGGPGYTLPAEFGMKHERGSIAAARMGDAVNPEKRSSGSQFYICLKDLPHLDRAGYTVFGKVIKGMEVVDRISNAKCDNRDRPLKDIIMKSVYVTNRKSLNLKLD